MMRVAGQTTNKILFTQATPPPPPPHPHPKRFLVREQLELIKLVVNTVSVRRRSGAVRGLLYISPAYYRFNDTQPNR